MIFQFAKFPAFISNLSLWNFFDLKEKRKKKKNERKSIPRRIRIRIRILEKKRNKSKRKTFHGESRKASRIQNLISPPLFSSLTPVESVTSDEKKKSSPTKIKNFEIPRWTIDDLLRAYGHRTNLQFYTVAKRHLTAMYIERGVDFPFLFSSASAPPCRTVG